MKQFCNKGFLCMCSSKYNIGFHINTMQIPICSLRSSWFFGIEHRMKKCILLVLIVIVTKGYSYPMDFYNTPICAKYHGYYKTFPNIQALMLEIKYTGNVWCLVKLAECHNIYNSCPLDYKPICAYSEVLNQFKTFPNQCLMNIEMYTTGFGWIAAFPFVCPRYSQSYPIYSQRYPNPSYEYMTPSITCATSTLSPNRQQTNSSVLLVQVADDALDPEILLAENATATTSNKSEEFEQSDSQLIESSTLLSSNQEEFTESTVTSNPPTTLTDTTSATEISTTTGEPTTDTTESDELSTITEEPTTDTTEAEEPTMEAEERTTIAQETLQTDQDDNQFINSFRLLSSEQEISTENPATTTDTTNETELSTTTEDSTTDATDAGELSTITEEPTTDTTEAEELSSITEEPTTEAEERTTIAQETFQTFQTDTTSATEISTITEQPTTDTTEAEERTTIAQETLQTDQVDNQFIKSFRLLSSEQEVSTEDPATSTDITKATELSTITEEPLTSTTEAVTTASATTNRQETLQKEQTTSVLDTNNQFIKSFRLLNSEQEISTENPATPTTPTCSSPQSRLLAVISQPMQAQSAPITRTNQHNIYNGPYAERDFYHQPVHNYYNWSPLNSYNTTEFPCTNSPLVGPNSRSPNIGQFLYGPYARGIPVLPINSLVVVNCNDWLNFVTGLQN